MEQKASVVPVSNVADSPQNSGVGESKPSLEPLVITGVTTVTIGTALWAAALVLCLLFQDQLAASNRSHWSLIALAGVFLGLLGRRYAIRRALRLGISE